MNELQRSLVVARRARDRRAAAGQGYYWFHREPVLTVTAETIRRAGSRRDRFGLRKIQPKRLVSVSADTPGRVVDLAVAEGDRVRKGQFLLQDRSAVAERASTTAPLRSARQRLRSSKRIKRCRPRACSSIRRRKPSLASRSSGGAVDHTGGARESRERGPGGAVGAARARKTGDGTGRSSRTRARRP